MVEANTCRFEWKYKKRLQILSQKVRDEDGEIVTISKFYFKTPRQADFPVGWLGNNKFGFVLITGPLNQLVMDICPQKNLPLHTVMIPY